jgi:hypothetical protein
MIVGKSFDGDDNIILSRLQHDVYSEMLGQIFKSARDRYLTAASLVGVEDELSQRLNGMWGFDHRTLQTAHDRIAAYFRFQSPDSAQLRLGEDDVQYRDRLTREWREFLGGEVGELAQHDEYVRAVCTAAAFGNTEPGYTAEEKLDQFLTRRYASRGLRFPEPPGRSLEESAD